MFPLCFKVVESHPYTALVHFKTYHRVIGVGVEAVISRVYNLRTVYYSFINVDMREVCTIDLFFTKAIGPVSKTV